MKSLALRFAACLALLAPAAAAQQPIPDTNGDGMDVHLFRPAVDSKGFMYVNGTDVLTANSWSFGMVLDYGRNMLRLNRTPGSANAGSPTALLADSFQGVIGVNYGIANILALGITVPAVIVKGTSAAELGPSNAPTPSLDYQRVASGIAGHAKLRILRVEHGLGLAVIAQAGIPAGGAERQFAAQPGVWYWPRLAAETRVANGDVRIGVNAGYLGRTGKGPTFGKDSLGFDQLAEGTLEGSNQATYGVALSYRILPALELVAENYGSLQVGSASTSSQALSQETLGGIKLYVEQNSYLMMGGGSRAWSKGYEAGDLRLVLGFVFEPSVGDKDGDGIKDDLDACPDVPEDLDGVEDSDGCPEDNDKDGIPDDRDKCPNTPEDKDGDEDQDGCPESRMTDRDGDGILDGEDKCPDVKEDLDGVQDKDGCPEDNDKDGIPDDKDKCPNTPEDKDGHEDEDGCPELEDRDADGIPDSTDKCPDKPEDKDGVQDEDGCPEGSVIVEKDEITILQKIQFETGSSKIRSESNALLDEITSVLKENAQIVVIEVAGHADERSDEYSNLGLTKARAKSVMDAMIARGVGRERLVSQGYGEYCPVDKGHDEKAWEKNRRVEFRIVKTKDGLSDAPRGCAEAEKKNVKPPVVK